MDRRTRARVATAAAGAVLALAALQGSGAGAQTVAADVSSPADVSSSPATVCHGTRPEGSLPDLGFPDDTPLQRTLNHVDKLAYGRFAEKFTSMAVDEEDSSADVYRIPSASFDAAVCGIAEKGVTLRLHDTDIDEEGLTAIVDRISEDMGRWDGTFQLREVGLDGRGHVHIGVDDPETAEPILRKAFGERIARYLRVEYTPQAELK
ncbi:hypothetical protein ACIQVC_01175 [Streptomyces sp. NPDC101112]|jgi:hypothetical protein|uniref:hypothetical protein n=1 Tax=Streptomyces sp. NPDC101112 TaxID=3366105 RepID=UPI0038241724